MVHVVWKPRVSTQYGSPECPLSMEAQSAHSVWKPRVSTQYGSPECPLSRISGHTTEAQNTFPAGILVYLAAYIQTIMHSMIIPLCTSFPYPHMIPYLGKGY